MKKKIEFEGTIKIPEKLFVTVHGRIWKRLLNTSAYTYEPWKYIFLLKEKGL